MKSTTAWITTLEVSGTQAYIFASNRLAQNIGASELVFRSCTEWVLDAIREVRSERTGSEAPALWSERTGCRASMLLDISRNPAIPDGAIVEVVLSTSGKALLLTTEKSIGDSVVSKVTAKARTEAPGLDLCGATIEFDLSADPFSATVEKLSHHLQELRSRLPRAEQRHLRLPVAAECRSSGYPASEIVDRPKKELISLVARSKQLAASQAIQRLSSGLPEDLTPFPTLEALERDIENLEWLSVVHVDGNDIGARFARLNQLPEVAGVDVLASNRRYITTLRWVSVALELHTERAYHQALRALHGWETERKIPVVPLILGGDDLTAFCAGRSGIRFAEAFQEAFEQLNPPLPVPEDSRELWQHFIGQPALNSAAGVAVVKPHFPFHAACDLAGELSVSAKGAKGIGSALDFHLLRDTTHPELARIRSHRWSEDGKVRLYGGPYLIRDAGSAAAPTLTDVRERAAAAMARDEDTGARRIPSSVLHRLRDLLHGPTNRLAAEFGLIPGSERLKPVLDIGEVLLNGRSDFLDALDLATVEDNAAH